MNTYTDVTLVLWNLDVIDLLSLALFERNLRSRGMEPSEGVERIERLIHSSSPSVVVLDLEPPYDRSASVAHYLMDRFPDSSFVMTCADSKRVRRAAPWLTAHPIFQKPYQMDDIADKVGSIVSSPFRSLAAGTRFFADVRWKRPVEKEVRAFGPPLSSADLVAGRRRLLN